MKIKNDFVTNSSSCSYVIFLPPNIKHLLDKVEEFLENIDFIDDFEMDANSDEEFLTSFEKKKLCRSKLLKLVSGNHVWFDENDIEYYIGGLILSFINKNEIPCLYIDNGPENMHIFWNLYSTKNLDRITNLLLLMKGIKKDEILECSGSPLLSIQSRPNNEKRVNTKTSLSK